MARPRELAPALACAALLGPFAAAPAAAIVAGLPGCGSQLPARPATDGTPWTQRRYPPEQLAGLATGAGVTVAVIDSGVDARHPHLVGRVRAGTDYLDPEGDGRRDCTGHGTAVASIIAAAPGAGTPLRGLAPDARILPVRVSEQLIDSRGSGRTSGARQLAQAIRWSVEQGTDVINLSVVLYQDVDAVRSAVAYAVARDVVVVAAAGNLHAIGDPRPYPASYPEVLGVGAVDANGTRSEFSQVGPYVDLVAPGVGVPAAALNGRLGEHDGTSYATPFVSATAALLRQYRPALTATQVADRLLASTDPAPGSGDGYGRGVLNPYRAVTGTTGSMSEQPARGLPPVTERQAADSREVRRDRARRSALLIGTATIGLTGLTLVAAVVVHRGIRRRWSPAHPGSEE